MSQPVFRFAPSANGRLHVGHAYSALLNDRMARAAGGRFLVRIEDTDQTRCTPQLAALALDDLAWLGLEWEKPVRVQSQHFADYDANLAKLWALQAIYPCFCSRTEAAARARDGRDPDGQKHYAGTCKTISRDEAVARTNAGAVHGWRIDMARVGNESTATWGDMMIAKKKVGSSYHIAVVTDDALQGVTHVVRGKDIEAATPVHMLLQRLLGLPTPHYHHHDLIRDGGGQKLSKSLKSQSLAALREAGAKPAGIRERLGF